MDFAGLNPLGGQGAALQRRSLTSTRNYQMPSRNSSEHAIIQRPDRVSFCQEQTALRTTVVRLKLDDRLSVLRAEDRFGKRRSLNEERFALSAKEHSTAVRWKSAA